MSADFEVYGGVLVISDCSHYLAPFGLCYFSGVRTIIFTETRDSASQLAGLLPALHGDIQ